MRFLVSADETGNVKEVICPEGTDTSQKEGIQPELIRSVLEESEHLNVRSRIKMMKVVNDNKLVTARIGGFIDFYDVTDRNSDEYGKFLRSVDLRCEPSDKPVALIEDESRNIVIVAFESSKLFFVNLSKEDDPVVLNLPGRTTEASSISAFTSNPYEPGIFAYGGKDNDLQVIKLFNNRTLKKQGFRFDDVNSWKLEVLFKAENVEPDHLGLDVPIWITGILFQKGSGSKTGYKIVTSTGYGHIRQYDTLSDDEPVGSFKVCERPITNLKFASDSQEDIIISDTHNYIAVLSLVKVDAKAVRIVSASAGTFYKPSLKVLGRYSQGGNTGAINDITSSPSSNIIATGGLDRYLRVFEVQTRKLLAKVYLGTQISSICFLEDDSSFAIDKESINRAEEQLRDDEIWEQLENNKETDDKPLITKRRRRI